MLLDWDNDAQVVSRFNHMGGG
eukprot:COSAG06_NODE_25615_length_632_cov_1.647280_1_plen_21_part_10